MIPAIDLIDGRCVRLYQGDYSRETVYADDPVEVALRWESLGASRVHIVDLDGARSGNLDNLAVVKRIAEAVKVPVQMGGGVRSLDSARRVIEAGVQRVMLGTVAVREPDIVRSACAEFGSEAVVVAVDSKDGVVAVSGWTSGSDVKATELVARMMEAGVRTFLCTDISRDGTYSGPNYSLIRDLVNVAGDGVIAAGGITSVGHLQTLVKTGVSGAVIGKALYTGEINLSWALEIIELTSTHYFKSHKFVCVECFDDPGIKEFITRHSSKGNCSFCGTAGREEFVADFDDVAEHIKNCLFREYDLAINQLGYDGEEGDYVGRKWDTEDLLYDLELALPNDSDARLFDMIVEFLGDEPWCEYDAYSLNDDESARYSWKTFSDTVMYERHYFFSDYNRYPDDRETDSPGEVLRKIFNYAKGADLFKDLPDGTPLYRARRQSEDSCFQTARELGPPPKDKATQTNRMSPPGIVMFYAGDEIDTALMETAQGPGKFSVGKFETLRTIKVLDLTSIPPIPSLFQEIHDRYGYRARMELKFLHYIAEQISQPIARDDRVHIKYVPTQVVTEFIRSQVTVGGENVDGIMYESSVRPGHTSYVIFATQDNLVLGNSGIPDDDRWIMLAEASCHKFTSKHS